MFGSHTHAEQGFWVTAICRLRIELKRLLQILLLTTKTLFVDLSQQPVRSRIAFVCRFGEHFDRLRRILFHQRRTTFSRLVTIEETRTQRAHRHGIALLLCRLFQFSQRLLVIFQDRAARNARRVKLRQHEGRLTVASFTTLDQKITRLLSTLLNLGHTIQMQIGKQTTCGTIATRLSLLDQFHSLCHFARVLAVGLQHDLSQFGHRRHLTLVSSGLVKANRLIELSPLQNSRHRPAAQRIVRVLVTFACQFTDLVDRFGHHSIEVLLLVLLVFRQLFENRLHFWAQGLQLVSIDAGDDHKSGQFHFDCSK